MQSLPQAVPGIAPLPAFRWQRNALQIASACVGVVFNTGCINASGACVRQVRACEREGCPGLFLLWHSVSFRAGGGVDCRVDAWKILPGFCACMRVHSLACMRAGARGRKAGWQCARILAYASSNHDALMHCRRGNAATTGFASVHGRGKLHHVACPHATMSHAHMLPMPPSPTCSPAPARPRRSPPSRSRPRMRACLAGAGCQHTSMPFQPGNKLAAVPPERQMRRRVNVPLTQAQWEWLTAESRREGMTLAQYMRVRAGVEAEPAAKDAGS